MGITQADITRLIKEPSAAVRAGIAHKVCDSYNHESLSERSNNIAVDIVRLLLRDTEARVRKVLATELCHNPQVPHDIVMSLAEDHESVAEDVLKYSMVLTEEDLVAIVESTQNLAKLKAIAGRDSLSAPVAHSLILYGEKEVTKQLIHNPGAAFDEQTLNWLMDEYQYDESILEDLVCRGGLPYAYAEKLFLLVSDQLKKQLCKRYRLLRPVAEETTKNAREVAVMEFLSPRMNEREIDELVNEMDRNRRLTDSLIIRSLCIGDLRFFGAALSKRANVSPDNARILLMDAGKRGFHSVYRAARMPETFCSAILCLFELVRDEQLHGREQGEAFSQRIIERIVEEGHDNGIENMPYLLSILGRSMQEGYAVH